MILSSPIPIIRRNLPAASSRAWELRPMVVYPIIYKVLAPSQVVSRISEPSTVVQGVFSSGFLLSIHILIQGES